MASAAPAPTSTKQDIIASLFSKRAAEDGALEESYISHVKIFEDEGGEGGVKARYLLLAAARSGRCFVHKAKRNSNGTFSKGKTWNLEDLCTLEVQDPGHFSLTFSRPYKYTTDRPHEQAVFLEAVVKVFQRYMKGKLPQLVGFQPREDGLLAREGGPPSSSPASGHTSLPVPPIVRPDRRPSHDSTASAGSSSRLQPGSRLAEPRPSFSAQSGTSAYSDGRDTPETVQRALPELARKTSNTSLGGGERRRMSTPKRDNTPLPPPTIASPPRASISKPRGAPSSPARPLLASTTALPGLVRRMSKESVARPSLEIPAPLGRPIDVPSPTIRVSPSDGGRTRDLPPPSSSSAVAMDKARSSPVAREAMPDIPEAARRPSASASTTPRPALSTRSTGLAPSPSASRAASPNPSLAPSTASRLTAGSSASGGAPPPSSLRPPGIGGTLSPAVRRSVMLPMAVQTSFSRDLLLSDDPLTPSTSQVDADADGLGGAGDEDMILANVEEMLDGWDWNAVMGFSGAPGAVGGGAAQGGMDGLFGFRGVEGLGKGKGKDWEMEKRLADELNALQGANIYSLLETDDRVVQVLDSIDDVISQLDTMDAKISTYKIQLNAVSEDISYIESQNRGLQVQTSNQKALLAELENLLTIVQVDNEDLMTLTQESPGTDKGIVALEGAACSLYKALQATKETAVGDMQAAMERSGEYQSYNAQFCKRLSDYMAIMFKFQADEIMADKSRSAPGGIPSVLGHDKMEANLIKYSGLVLYMKEMDEPRYQKLAATYFGIASDLHRVEMKALLLAYIARLKKSSEEDAAELFVTGGAGPGLTPMPKGAVAIARSKTVSAFKNPMDGGKKDKRSDSEMRISEAFERAFTPVITAVYQEEVLIAEFLHINSQDGSTFADYMGLEQYVRRQASRIAARGTSQAVQQLMRSSMDLIFGFLAPELKAWIEGALQRDMMQIAGVMAACERFLIDAEERSEAFVVNLFQRQLQRLNTQLEQFILKVVRAIESTKLTTKKRKGVAPFVKFFPVFIDRFESQLVGTDGLQIRKIVDTSYERIANTIFDSLQQMAKMDGADGLAAEDKGQLNYHVILIENMHYLVGELASQNQETFSGLTMRAQGIYRDNLASYMRLVLRKPLSRLMDFFDGIERVLHSGAASPAEIPNQPMTGKSALKRVIKEHDAKDLRKAIEAIYKRIDKHFDLSSAGDGPSPSASSSTALIEVVADEVQGELSALTDKWSSLISRCYPDSGLSLEFTTNDIASSFKRAKAGL